MVGRKEEREEGKVGGREEVKEGGRVQAFEKRARQVHERAHACVRLCMYTNEAHTNETRPVSPPSSKLPHEIALVFGISL